MIFEGDSPGGCQLVVVLPLDRWMVYFMEYTILKWMMVGGIPISGNLHIQVCRENGDRKSCSNVMFSCHVVCFF